MQFVWAFVALVAAFALSAIITPHQQDAAPSTLKDFDFPQFEEGTPETVFFGDCWSPDFMVLYYGNLRSEAVKSKGGKK